MKKIILLVLAAVLFYPGVINAYLPQRTHRLINEKSLDLSNVDSYIKSQLGFANGVKEIFSNKSIMEWIKQGGEDEDANIRGVFHFHDPTKAWNNAGIWGIAFSSLDWAQDHSGGPVPTCSDLDRVGLSCPPPPPGSNPEWSWPGARKYYYEALTSGDAAIRGEKFGKIFLTLGHVMHLLADAALPEHVRNDSHLILGSLYEKWGETNQVTLKTFIASNANPIDYSVITNISNVPGYISISNFWDTTLNPGYGGTVGLAEYTNYNFLSPRTIFKDYAYPAKPMHHFERFRAEDGQYDNKVYFSGTTSDNIAINHLASTGYLWADLENISPFSMDAARFNLDDNSFKDYANILVPKAVGYSAGLLNYFFRGEVEITLPDSGAYAVTGEGSSFQQIRLKAKNITASGEEMTNGTIQVIAKYTIAQEDPFQGVPVEPSGIFFYAVSPAVSVGAIPKDNPIEFTFDLSQNPIPVWATDVYLQVVYKGKLGNEEDAVAVGFKDISEPTPYDIINNMHRVCVDGVWIAAGSLEAEQAFGGLNYAAHRMVNIYLAFSSGALQNASPTHFTTSIPEISPGASARTFILSDLLFNVSFYYSIPHEEGDVWPGYPDFIPQLRGNSNIPTMKNQTDLINGITTRTYSILAPWQGRWVWAGYAIENFYYHGSPCE